MAWKSPLRHSGWAAASEGSIRSTNGRACFARFGGYMPATASPMGVRVSSHRSGDPRFQVFKDGILSGYGTSLFTGSPVKMNTDGTIIAATAVNDPIFGIFAGCEYTDPTQMRRVLPLWLAGSTYVPGSMLAKVV